MLRHYDTLGLLTPEPELESYSLSATEVASIVHHGPMNTISTAYQALAHWAESTGCSPESPRWREHYLEAAGDDESNWIVELQLVS
ncbi:hypothetical protein GCM10009789_30210 [Kribbella sancticallisti]|uniref:GyrI-like small molecule binding domain-containing protein n=1 Tax=Kribbella sancticallisti TaxID=460087 RepID=A0ABP4P8N6_9ACTN